METKLYEKLYNTVDIIKDIVENSDFKKLFDYCNDKDKLPTFIFSGVGKNWYICEKEMKTYLSMGINARSLDCTHALHGDLGMLMDKDEDKVLIFISKSGKTKEMEKLVYVVKDLIQKQIIKNIKICALFLKNKNEFAYIYDYVMNPRNTNDDNIDIEIDDKGLIPSLSIHITQMVLDILGVKLYEQRNNLVENYKYNHLAGNNGNKLGMSKYLENIKV